MSLTLGLNTALSGLLTSQRGLDVIAQNVVNVNTPGYTRKVMNQEARVLAGNGAGVQVGQISRMVNEGLLKDIRRQTTTVAQLKVEQDYYPRIDDLFGEVGDNSSISHKLNDLFAAFETLGTTVDKPAVQWSTVQSAADVANLLDDMTTQLQDLRLQADREIEKVVQLVNDQLNIIHDLNQKIVRNGALSSGTADLEDQRDTAMTKLSEYVDIQYFKRADGGFVIYTTSGQMLLDNQPQPLSFSATNRVDAWMSAAAGDFGNISVEGGTTDLGPEIVSGELRAYLDMRDKVVPNIQASLDELAVQMKERLNQVHNRGTSLPNVASSYTGTRSFAKQGDIVSDAADAVATLYRGGGTVAHGGLAFAAGSGSYPWQATITATNPVFTAANFPDGTVFTISGADTARNSGTYRVVSRVDNQNIIVEKVNPRQTIQLGGTDDVVIATFDSEGNQLKQTTLNAIMQNDYQATYGLTPGTGRNVADFDNKTSRGDWSINEVSAHIESWLKSQGYTSASVNLNSDGKMVANVGDTAITLAFRDQGSSTVGADAADATINFDVDGDGNTDQTVTGFSNFFGFNDFYTTTSPNSVFDSKVQSTSFTTSSTRDLTLLDSTGQIGNTISIPAGASLATIAAAINAHTRTNESAALSTTSWTTTSAATITVSDSSGTIATVPIGAGSVTLEQIAGLLSTSTLTASVVEEGSYKRLRVSDSRGVELTVDISGGDISGGTDLAKTLDMRARQRLNASVVPEGSGQRLRIVHEDNSELYASSTLDGNSENLLTDIGLQRAATRTAGMLSVRSDLQSAPEKLARGTVQWNSDLSRYYISEGDNTTALAMSTAMNQRTTMETAGSIYRGSFSLSEYAAASISVVARDANYSKDRLDYQQTLVESLDFQNSSLSGVNMDEEVSAMIDFQQAYSASAKVITTLQEMLEILTSMIR